LEFRRVLFRSPIRSLPRLLLAGQSAVPTMNSSRPPRGEGSAVQTRGYFGQVGRIGNPGPASEPPEVTAPLGAALVANPQCAPARLSNLPSPKRATLQPGPAKRERTWI